MHIIKGWTTWTTAAVDKRVFAAIPIVMDLLNLNQVNKIRFQKN
jgi:PhoPQ-activated pathogenicity-related protein